MCLLGASGAAASTVLPMSIHTLSDHAGQAFVGRVSAVQSYWAGDPKRIVSAVTFSQVDYLKGRSLDATDTFTLIAPGGTVGSTRARVCCAPVFDVGDKWVLLLLPSYKTHPVVGLYQGAFLVRPDDQGVERVHRRRHGVLEPVAGLDTEGFVQVTRPTRVSAHDRLVSATHVRLVPPPTARSGAAKAMRLDDFLAAIRPVLAASRDHELTGPAGRPERGPLVAVPMRGPVPLPIGPSAGPPLPRSAPARFRAAPAKPAADPRPRRDASVWGGPGR
jgi:hypothetical protein